MPSKEVLMGPIVVAIGLGSWLGMTLGEFVGVTLGRTEGDTAP
jgi:hypothetical protein